MGTTQVQAGLMVTLSYIMPAASFLFMSFQPGAIQLYFFASALLAFLQSRLLTNNYCRSFLGLHPVPPKNLNSASSNSGNNTASTTSTIPEFGPGGLTLYKPPRPISPSKANDVSIIDKLVDGAKTRKNEAMDGLYGVMGTTKEKKAKEARTQETMRQAVEYERMMKRQETEERVERNRIAMEKFKGKVTRERSGGARRKQKR